MPGSKNAESIARELIEAFCAADTQQLRSLLADDLRAYVTNREGGVDEVGAEEWWMLEALPAESDAFWSS